MDLGKYTFRVVECASLLDEIEPRLGVKFDRKELFDHEQSLIDQSQRGSRMYDVRWTFKFSKDGVGVRFLTSRGDGHEEVKECGDGNHVEFTSTGYGYGTNALDCALNALDRNVGRIQTIRKKLQGKQMTPQDKETHMHETIARASLVAFAEFIGQPISDLDAAIQQARGLYGREGKKIAVVIKIPVDKTKPITANAVDSQGVHDGVKSDSDAVTLSYWPIASESNANTLRIATGGVLQFAKDANERLAVIRAQQAPAPVKPANIPLEKECRQHIKELNRLLGINLNESAVLSAGEVARATHQTRSCDSRHYILSICKDTRLASFHVASELPNLSPAVVVAYVDKIPCDNGLECALSKMESEIPKILKELTQQPRISQHDMMTTTILKELTQQPRISQHDMMTTTARLDDALEVRSTQYVVYIFHTTGGKVESTKRTTDADSFSAMLSGGQPRLYLAFKNKQDRSEGGRVTAHVSTEPLSESGFDVTISAEINTSSPLDTISRLIESITKANL